MNDITFSRDRLSGVRVAGSEDMAAAGPPMLTRVLSVVRRRKWVIASSVFLALLGGLLFSLLATPQYTAEAVLEVRRESNGLLNVRTGEQNASPFDQEFYQTQYGLLRSEALAERIARDLALADKPEFFTALGVTPADEWFAPVSGTPTPATRAARLRAAAGLLLNSFSVSPDRLSRLVRIRFTSPDPELSKRVVDAWSEGFIQQTLERRYEASSYARNFLERRLGQLRSRIDESERQLVAYAAQQGIVNLPAQTNADGSVSTPERSLLVDDLEALNDALARAVADRVQAESRLTQNADEVTEALENGAITALRRQRAELAAEYAKMMVQFEEEYPPARALDSQIRQLDRALAREETRVRNSLRETYRAATEREQMLTQRVDQLKAGLLDLRRRSIQYNIYQRDADTNRELYNALLQNYKEIGVGSGVGESNISVVDAAQVPGTPSSPNVPLNMMLALLLGLIVGAGVAVGLEQIDQGITDPGDIAPNLGLPLLGTIPNARDGEARTVLDDRKSVLTEAYLSVQTNLAFSTDHGVPRTLGVTSTRPAEGKTTTSYALALMLARSKRRVLLIDGDMRSPSMHHLFDLKNATGLSNYLSGSDDVSMIYPTRYENLSVMVAGPQPPSSPELLSGERLSTMLAMLLNEYDHIVVDMPPVMGLADAPLIGSQVEAVVFVVEAHSTQKSMAKVAIDRLSSADAAPLGAILTKFDNKRAHYGYGYEYGYGYGYGQVDTARDAA